jgi:hypothetical protein
MSDSDLDQENFYEEMEELGYSESQADSLYEIAKKCLVTDGAFGAGVGATAGLVMGGSVSLGALSLPGWVAGFLVGAATGTAACVAPAAGIKARYGVNELKRYLDRAIHLRGINDALDQVTDSD